MTTQAITICVSERATLWAHWPTLRKPLGSFMLIVCDYIIVVSTFCAQFIIECYNTIWVWLTHTVAVDIYNVWLPALNTYKGLTVTTEVEILTKRDTGFTLISCETELAKSTFKKISTSVYKTVWNTCRFLNTIPSKLIRINWSIRLLFTANTIW
jgi:hypothetical protein